MDLLLLLLYAGFATAIFKIFKIPLNKYTVPTAILGGGSCSCSRSSSG